MPTPTGTYRVQLSSAFGFRDTAAVVPYLASLGVSHLHLSPILEAAPGSTHGYDVVDHGTISGERGGDEGWHVLQSALREHGLGCVVDIVPNHMAVPAPESANQALWAVLRDGPAAATASWFDIDWAAGRGKLVLPVLGSAADDAIAAGELVRDGEVLRYAGHEFPLAEGTHDLPLPEAAHAQHYRLVRWSDPAEPPNYRRFFDVDDLIGLRVETDEVFDATHRLLLDLVHSGDVQGLRVDHPDGLADPRGYLRRLREAAPHAWIVVEKILAGGETLPADWPCDGTTGYDTLDRVDSCFVDPSGFLSLVESHRELTGEHRDFTAIAREAKQHVLTHVLTPERDRLLATAATALGRADLAQLGAALDALLVAMPVYRTYLVPGERPSAHDTATLDRARCVAAHALGHDTEQLDRLTGVLLGHRPRTGAGDEFVVRFQQTAAALTAKGIEDTAGYRWHALVSRCEVGVEPDRLDGDSREALHSGARAGPARGMTTLSTHDTKRSEDVRARLAVLTEIPAEWAGVVSGWMSASSRQHPLDPPTAYHFWQTLVGAWPVDADRLTDYLRKACREAKRATSWLAPERDYERLVSEYVHAALGDRHRMSAVARFVDRTHRAWVTNLLAQKLVQLTLPGVPDCYQGTEAVRLLLVDPDNRRPADYGHLGGLLAGLDTGGDPPPAYREPDAAKLLLTSRALRLRATRPDLFTDYRPLAADGIAADHVLAFDRGGVVTVAPLLPLTLHRDGGWRDTTVTLPAGPWTDALTGAVHTARVRLADVLDPLPVALLARTGSDRA